MSAASPAQALPRTAARTSAAGLALGGAGLAAALFVVVRLVERWRISPGAGAAHRVTILGATLSYPAANLDAIVLLVLAAAGLGALLLALAAVAAELRAQRRLRAWITSRLVSAPPPAADWLVLDDERVLACCAGLLRPRAYITTGALARLTPEALAAVLAHERHHAARRDPLRLAAARVLSRALGPVPGLAGLLRHAEALAEITADAAAIAADPAGRSALAGAILVFDGADPARIDHLLGDDDPARWRFPTLLAILAAGTLALLVAVALLAARVAAGEATLAPPLLSAQPCVVVLAALTAAVGLLAAARRSR